jgi:hypothetical protein
MNDPVPLRDLPIAILVDDVEVRGKITTLYPNDLTVVITEPVSGLSSGLHIPWFAMHVRAVATALQGRTAAITPYGQEQAERLLRRCYNYWRGEQGGWPVNGLGGVIFLSGSTARCSSHFARRTSLSVLHRRGHDRLAECR